jgi:Integral membrane protein EMC3/TMCO1-like
MVADSARPVDPIVIVLDPAIRNWVLVPIMAVMILMGLLRHYVSMLMARSAIISDSKKKTMKGATIDYLAIRETCVLSISLIDDETAKKKKTGIYNVIIINATNQNFKTQIRVCFFFAGLLESRCSVPLTLEGSRHNFHPLRFRHLEARLSKIFARVHILRTLQS